MILHMIKIPFPQLVHKYGKMQNYRSLWILKNNNITTVCITPCSENLSLESSTEITSFSAASSAEYGNWAALFKAHHSDIRAIPLLTNWHKAATPSCVHNGNKAHFHQKIKLFCFDDILWKWKLMDHGDIFYWNGTTCWKHVVKWK